MTVNTFNTVQTETSYISFSKEPKQKWLKIEMIFHSCVRLLQAEVLFAWTRVLCGNRRFWHPSAVRCSLKEHVHMVNSLWQNIFLSLSSAVWRFNCNSLWGKSLRVRGILVSMERLQVSIAFDKLSVYFFFLFVASFYAVTINSFIYSWKCHFATME